MSIKRKIINLRLYLAEKGIKQSELVQKTGLSKGFLQKILNTGKATNAHIKLMSLTLDLPEAQFIELLKEYKA